MTKIRTRFAPSPTGDLHLGSLRTALFNWLWARKNQGEFILRLEDTDQNRLVPQAAEHLLRDLQILGLNWDFGPNKPSPQFGSCIQSQRLDLYQDIVQKLLQQNLAYYDYTPAEEVARLRQISQNQKRPFIFRRAMAQTKPTAPQQKPSVRLAVPDDSHLTWVDVVKTQQSWRGQDIGDFIILKSDGWPTYHLANVVDDHLMGISHVIRADEWLSSTPKHLYLFDCLGWQRPTYVHVPPVLLSSGGQKISKRDGGSRVADLLKVGYLNQALLNYLSLLGWNPKTEQEIFSTSDLVKTFDISELQTSGARFDIIKLNWFNGKHLRALPVAQRQASAEKWWPKTSQNFSQIYKNQVLELVYERLKIWSELTEMTSFFFQNPQSFDAEVLQKEARLETPQIENLIIKTIQALEKSDFSLGDLELKLYQLAIDEKVSPSKYFMLLRLKLTGRKVASGLFQTMHILGREAVYKRLTERS